MVYAQLQDRESAWFASFQRREEWRVDRAKGIAVDVLRRYLDPGA